MEKNPARSCGRIRSQSRWDFLTAPLGDRVNGLPAVF
jgi:hypothetical protein